MIYRCKECGGISYSGQYCSVCDESLIRFTNRRGVLKPLCFGIITGLAGIVLIFTFNHWSGYILCGVGMASVVIPLVVAYFRQKQVNQKLFEEWYPKEKDISEFHESYQAAMNLLNQYLEWKKEHKEELDELFETGGDCLLWLAIGITMQNPLLFLSSDELRKAIKSGCEIGYYLGRTRVDVPEVFKKNL